MNSEEQSGTKETKHLWGEKHPACQSPPSSACHVRVTLDFYRAIEISSPWRDTVSRPPKANSSFPRTVGIPDERGEPWRPEIGLCREAGGEWVTNWRIFRSKEWCGPRPWALPCPEGQGRHISNNRIGTCHGSRSEGFMPLPLYFPDPADAWASGVLLLPSHTPAHTDSQLQQDFHAQHEVDAWRLIQPRKKSPVPHLKETQTALFISS